MRREHVYVMAYRAGPQANPGLYCDRIYGREKPVRVGGNPEHIIGITSHQSPHIMYTYLTRLSLPVRRCAATALPPPPLLPLPPLSFAHVYM